MFTLSHHFKTVIHHSYHATFVNDFSYKSTVCNLFPIYYYIRYAIWYKVNLILWKSLLKGTEVWALSPVFRCINTKMKFVIYKEKFTLLHHFNTVKHHSYSAFYKNVLSYESSLHSICFRSIITFDALSDTK